MQIALIGYGKMGAALMAQWRQAAAAGPDAARFFVIDPAVQPAEPSANLTLVTEPPAEVVFDLIIVAVKPQLIDQVLPDYAERLAPGGCVASIAAGYPIQRLRGLMNGAPVVRIMPNLPAAIGAGVSGLCAGQDVTADHRRRVETLMAAAGSVLWVEDEDQLDRFTAVAGSGPGYVFELCRAYAQAAADLGFEPATARRLALDTLAGAVAMARQSDQSLEDLRDSVTSKGGTTAAGLAALNGDGGLDDRLRATLNAAYDRAVALR